RHTRFSRDWSSDVCSSDLCRSDPQGFNFFLEPLEFQLFHQEHFGSTFHGRPRQGIPAILAALVRAIYIWARARNISRRYRVRTLGGTSKYISDPNGKGAL